MSENTWEQAWDKVAEEGIPETSVEDALPQQTEVPETVIVDKDILNDLLEEMRVLRAQADENKRLADEKIEEMAAQVKAAEAKISDPMAPNIAMDNWVRLRTDRPAKLEDKLNFFEQQAKENNQPFDRERTRKILLGEPVEDANKWVYKGHAFNTELEMLAYKAKAEAELERVVGKYPR